MKITSLLGIQTDLKKELGKNRQRMGEIYITLGTPQADALQKAISDKLSMNDIGENDVLAEFLVVMIANRKEKDQIVAELRDIVGNEMNVHEFSVWLFTEYLPALYAVKTEPMTATTPMPTTSLTSTVSSRLLNLATKEAELSVRLRQHEANLQQRLREDSSRKRTNSERGDDGDIDDGSGLTNMDPTTTTTTRITKRPRPLEASTLPAIKTEDESQTSSAFEAAKRATTFTITINKSQKLVRDEKPVVRCSFWPNCTRDESCNFWHPRDFCPHFPNCRYADNECLFIHPASTHTIPMSAIECKFGAFCTRPDCMYAHPSPSFAFPPVAPKRYNNGGSISSKPPVCRFFPNCRNAHCTFSHPTGSALSSTATSTPLNETPCKYVPFCSNPSCPYKHESDTSQDNARLVNERKKHISERAFALDLSDSSAENEGEKILPGKKQGYDGLIKIEK